MKALGRFVLCAAATLASAGALAQPVTLTGESPMAKWLGAPASEKNRVVGESFRYRLAITSGDLMESEKPGIVACLDQAFKNPKFTARDFDTSPISGWISGCVATAHLKDICTTSPNPILCAPK